MHGRSEWDCRPTAPQSGEVSEDGEREREREEAEGEEKRAGIES